MREFKPFRAGKPDSRFFKPKKSINCKFLKYANVEKLVNDIGKIEKDERTYIVADGTFIFGDFLEAFITHHDFKIKKLTVSTLSMNKNNVDSFHNLIKWGHFAENAEFNLIVSDFFYSHNKSVIPYFYETLGTLDLFQLAVASTHMKITQFELENGEKYIFHGSGNLISSNNLEQMCLEQNDEVYDFFDDLNSQLVEKYKTIKKAVRNYNIRDIAFFQEEKESNESFNK